MKISDLIKMGLRNLFRRKARTALTIVGVVIGTISIVVMVSIGIGMTDSFDRQIMQNGSMTIIQIQKYGSIYDDDGNWVGSKEQVIDDALVEQVKQIEHVKAVSPVIQKYVRLESGKYSTGLSIYAMDSSVFPEFGFPELQYGSYPTKEHPQTIVLSPQSMSYFYYYSGRNYSETAIDPREETVTMKFQEYEVNTRKKEFELDLTDIAMMEESDNWVYSYYSYMDLGYFKEIWTKYANTLKLEDRKKAMAQISQYEEIRINVDNVKNVTKVQEAIEELGYATYSEMQWLEPLQQTSKMLQMVLGAIGGVAMLVSAINIANTMIMSIYERTKEIGIMKVLGCLVKDIKKLFLFEAGMIGLIGGIIGIGFSYAASWAINKYGQPLFASLMQSSGVYDLGDSKFSIIPFWLPFAAAGFGMLVGVLSGYFPARRATRISAIEAMKTES